MRKSSQGTRHGLRASTVRNRRARTRPRKTKGRESQERCWRLSVSAHGKAGRSRVRAGGRQGAGGALATGGRTCPFTKGTSVRLRNRRTGRRNGALLILGAVLSAAGLLLTVAPGLAATAYAQNAPSLIAKASVSRSQGLVPQIARAPIDSAVCLSGNSGYNRFLNCTHLSGEVDFYAEENGAEKLVGHITFQIEQTDELAAQSTTVTETVYTYGTEAVGETEPTGLALVATCGPGCKGASHEAVPLAEGENYAYTLHFVNSIAKNAVRFNVPTYNWEFTVGGGGTTLGREWRCDDKLRLEKAGCVYASFVPTVSMAGLKFVAASISKIQARGGPTQLHRNSFLTYSNRSAVCHIKLPAGWKPPAGWPLPIRGPRNRPRCDEYPFAGTWEGGTRLPASQRGTAWVPASEIRNQDSRLNAFYLANRVLNATSPKTKGDAFNVAA